MLTFNPDGTWLRTRDSEFQPAPFTDPAVDPNMLLCGWLHYQFDYTPGPTYGQWTLVDNWMPADGQYYSNQAIERQLPNGKNYLFYLDVSGGVAIYALGPHGMQRSAIIGGDQGLWNWTDSNGDGQVEDSEKVFHDGSANYQSLSPGWWIDNSGNAWIASWPTYVPGVGSMSTTVELPLQGFDVNGNPLYNWSKRMTVVAPDTSFWQFRSTNMRVSPTNGDIYEIGTTALNANIDGVFWMGGTTVEELAPDGSRIGIFPISPATGAPHLVAIAVDSDGNYFYTGHSTGDQQWVSMYTNDGLLVATGIVGADNGGSSGWIDQGMGLTAFTDPTTGTHYVYAEDVYNSRSIRYRVNNLDTLTETSSNFT